MRGHGTNDEARSLLVPSWAEVTGNGKSALPVASRNDDVRRMNELAREAVRERAFVIGHTLAGRKRAHGGVNGELSFVGNRDDERL